MGVERQQGINIANAALKTTTLKHYIWSTLPNGFKVSGGEYLVPHFESKNRVDVFIRGNEELLEKTTFLWVGWYAYDEAGLTCELSDMEWKKEKN